MEYNLHEPWKTLDPWQERLLLLKVKNICIVSGRQCGKTTIVALLAVKFALENQNQFILIGSGIIEQAQHLFRKIKDYIFAEHKDKLLGKPTLEFLEFDNGSKILCVPIGDTGDSMRGYTATMIIIDEAALVPDRAWEAIEPVIAVTKGRIILLSTPKFKKGFFYKSSLDKKNYNVETISARDCPRYTKEYLDRKQAEKSPIVFAQEYLGEFLDDYNRKFTEEWIDKVCTIEKEKKIKGIINFLGVDVGGGVGKGETTFETFEGSDKKNIFQIGHVFSDTIGGPGIERQIKTLKTVHNYGRKSIGYDSRGEGSGSFKYMREDSILGRCMVSLDNATRPTDREGKTTKLLKEFMYDLVEEMGWRGELHCFNEPSIKQSFESIQVEFKNNKEKGYSGSYDHIVEGIIRSVWLAKNKSLKLWVA